MTELDTSRRSGGDETAPQVTPAAVPVDRRQGGRGRLRWRPSTARTRILGWVLLTVLATLAVLTLVTWQLLLRGADTRMERALASEVTEFQEVVDDGVNPRTGAPFTSVAEVISEAIAYNTARPNEKFLGYVDGRFVTQSRQPDNQPIVLANDAAFTAEVGSVTEARTGTYDSDDLGLVRYLAVPVTLADDRARGVIVAAYLADLERESANEVAQLMLAVGAVTTLAAAVGAWAVARQILRPLRDVATTARSITETDLSGRIPLDTTDPDDRDELHDLVRSVNGMLDRLETAYAAQRRFVDDAGHELRTPITIVRGHLEVVNSADPEDVRSTNALVDDELERMNRMVSDLLLLAKAEQPEFVTPQPVDVAELTREIADKVSPLGERDWALETCADVEAVLDPQRITQAVVALADNACRHTGPGDRIALGSQLMGGLLRFWVADTGPGVPEADRERIFGRFSRGSTTVARSEGAGLGLAIVSAIAAAHGGHVLLDSVPGSGATFTVTVPHVRVPTEEADPWPAS